MRYILSVLLICAGVGTAVVLYLTKPKAKKQRPTRPAPLVEVAPMRLTCEPVTIEAYGTVTPARRLTLQAQVTGRIIHQDANLVLGGMIGKGEKLLQIDPADYELAVKQAEAAVAEAQFEVDTEQGRRVVAEREWKLLESEITTSDAGRRLALREPHKERAAARLEAARSHLAQAKLEEKRTTLTCPFNALVLDESVEPTQLVSPSDELATLVGTDEFWVQVSVPLGRLGQIRFANGGQAGSAARVVMERANGEPVIRDGHVLRVLGDLNPNGRMARVLVAVDDPLSLRGRGGAAAAGQAGAHRGRLLLGCYVKVEIDAGQQEGVYVVPRAALREGDRLWLVNGDAEVIFRDAQIVWRRPEEVLVCCRVEPTEKLVLSRLSAPLPRMKVRVKGAEPAATAPAATGPTTGPGPAATRPSAAPGGEGR